MAVNLVFTPAGGSPVTFTPGVAIHRTAGRFWEERPAPPPPVYGSADNESEGTDGVDVKIKGFRSRILGPFKVVYVAADIDSVLANFIADCDALAAKDVTMTIPNVSPTYPGCWLDAESMQGLHLVPQQTEALYFLEVGFIFINKRLS